MKKKAIEILWAVIFFACLLTGCGVLAGEKSVVEVQTSEQETA